MLKNLRILLVILVSDDLARALRAIKTCLLQTDHNINHEVHIVINTLNKEFEEKMIDHCEWIGLNFSVTECDGTPSTGKNSVFDVFASKEEFTHLIQLDGDDFLYPTFLKHIERHLRKYPTTDVLSILPVDSIYVTSEPTFHELKNGMFAGLWGTNYSCWSHWLPFDTDTIFSNSCRGNLARLMLFSRVIPNKFKYDKEQLIGEDYKLHFDLLSAHQKDEIIYWFSSASDTWVRDTTSFGVQKKDTNIVEDGHYVIKQNDFYQQRLREYVEQTYGIFRSGSGEIPIDFAPLYMGTEEKLEFLNKLL